jgi:hypothetical protein
MSILLCLENKNARSNLAGKIYLKLKKLKIYINHNKIIYNSMLNHCIKYKNFNTFNQKINK